MLGFLTNLRDMKSSLASGMIVLLALWLIFGNSVADVQQGESLAGNIRRLVEYTGPVGTLGLVTFIAYIVGMVLALDRVAMATLVKPNVVGGPRADLKSTKQLYVTAMTFYRLMKKLDRVIDEALDKSPLDFLMQSLLTTPKETREEIVAKENKDATAEALQDHLFDQLSEDLDIMAVQLHSKNDKAYDKYDKAKTEANFRAGLVLPLTFLGCVLVVRLIQEGSFWTGAIVGALTLLAAYWLAKRAASKQLEANEEILNAFLVGDIEFAPFTTLKDIASGDLKPSNVPNASIASPVGRSIREKERTALA